MYASHLYRVNSLGNQLGKQTGQRRGQEQALKKHPSQHGPMGPQLCVWHAAEMSFLWARVLGY